MSRLVLTEDILNELRSELLQFGDETCAILFGRAVMKNGKLARLVVRETQFISPKDYSERSRFSAQIRPEVVATAAQRARRTGESIVFVHSHPMNLNEFSRIDDFGERMLAQFLEERTPSIIHAAILVTPEVTIARVLGCGDPLEVLGIGSDLVFGKASEDIEESHAFDRQVRAFGREGQRRLRGMKIGIVGLGGTGALVLEQLTHLGIQKFLLCDFDIIERSNLNRVVGASESNVGRPKVDVAVAHAKSINPNVEVETLRGSVLLVKIAKELVDVDCLFCCTDSQGSRAVLNQFAYQYLVPVFDMGVAIVAKSGQVTNIVGRTQMLAPGLGCLVCGDLLNPEAVRVDLLTDGERVADPYIPGIYEPAPAVISLNGTIVSLAVTMFLSAVTGIPSRARLINYNGIAGTARSAMINQHPTCVVCSMRGALARADEWPLPARLS